MVASVTVRAVRTTLAIASSDDSPAQVGEYEERFGTHNDRQVLLELGQPASCSNGRILIEGDWGVVDEPKPVSRPGLAVDLRDHGPHRALPGEHFAEHELRRVTDPLYRVCRARHRRHRLGRLRRRPGAFQHLPQQ
jgi:hypothetical protein